MKKNDWVTFKVSKSGVENFVLASAPMFCMVASTSALASWRMSSCKVHSMRRSASCPGLSRVPMTALIACSHVGYLDLWK